MNRKVLAVIKREYITRAKTKGFIIGILLFPIIVAFLIGGVFLFAKVFQPSAKVYYVVDHTGRVYNELVKMLPDTLGNGKLKYRFIKKDIAGENSSVALEDFRNMVLQKSIDGYLIIPEDLIEKRQVRYSARNVSNFEEQEKISRALSRIVTNLRLENKGLSPDEVREELALGRISLVNRQITDEGEVEKSEANYVLALLLTYLMLLLIMIYGGTVSRSVIEEKNQRITETIISSLEPVELLLGKLAGICLLGITQLIVIGVVIIVSANYSEPMLIKFGVNSPEVFEAVRQIEFSPLVFTFMLIFFLLGYIFYAGLYAAVGAIVNTNDEAQHLSFPIIMLAMFGYFAMFSVAKNPDTTMAFWVSLFPFFTPPVMFSRIAVSYPVLPSGTYLSIAVMVFSIVVLIMIVAKIYRVGILMYGKKPSFKEVVKWLKYS